MTSLKHVYIIVFGRAHEAMRKFLGSHGPEPGEPIEVFEAAFLGGPFDGHVEPSTNWCRPNSVGASSS